VPSRKGQNMSKILEIVVSDPARAHEVVWALVGLALGTIAAIAIVVREIFHAIAVCKRAKEEYLPSKKDRWTSHRELGPEHPPNGRRRSKRFSPERAGRPANFHTVRAPPPSSAFTFFFELF